MESRYHPTPRRDDLELRSLSSSRWRVRDRRLDGRAGIGLLGFIDHSDGRYEVTRFDSVHPDGHPDGYPDGYPCLDDAVADFARRAGGREFF